MNSQTILAALVVTAAAWALRSLYLDGQRHQRNAARHQHNATRLYADLVLVRAERDDLLDILDANIDDMRRMAQERHPSAQVYGGGNLRVVK